jgi:hypothetical protein
MYITAAMLADKLAIDPQKSILRSGATGRFHSVRYLLPGRRRLDDAAAYVVDCSQLSTLEYINPNSLLICPAGGTVDVGCTLLVSRDGLESTLNAATAAFEAYDNFDGELMDGFLAGEDLDSLLAICSRFFRNTVQVLDPAFNVIAGMMPLVDPASGEVLGYQQDVSTFSPFTLDQMLKSNLLQETYAFQSAQFHQSPLFNHRAIISNLLHDGQYLGKLLVIESTSSLGQGSIDVANQITPYISHLMQTRSTGLNLTLHTAEHFISETLKGNISDASFIATQIARLGWRMDDWFIILGVEVKSPVLTDFYSQVLRNHLDDAVVFPTSGCLVAVARLKSADSSEAEKGISQILEEAHLQSGLSEIFADFQLARDHFLQAQSALSVAVRLKAAGALHRYKDHAIDHLYLAAAQADQQRAFIHPAIPAIVQYDRDNGTEYLATLTTFLASSFNQVLAARRLHIHRKTLQYRLTRLMKIAPVNLDDPDDQIRLALSLRFYENDLNK